MKMSVITGGTIAQSVMEYLLLLDVIPSFLTAFICPFARGGLCIS